LLESIQPFLAGSSRSIDALGLYRSISFQCGVASGNPFIRRQRSQLLSANVQSFRQPRERGIGELSYAAGEQFKNRLL
jgi:hypothetical protein